jgi:hypothetical protein
LTTFRSPRGAEPARLVDTDAEASSTGFVPAALDAFAGLPLSLEPPEEAFATPKATAKATTTAATVIPI